MLSLILVYTLVLSKHVVIRNDSCLQGRQVATWREGIWIAVCSTMSHSTSFSLDPGLVYVTLVFN